MKLQLSTEEARKVLAKLDVDGGADLKDVRARLAMDLATAQRSKMLDQDELAAAAAACQARLNQIADYQGRGLGSVTDAEEQQRLLSAARKLRALKG